ncbi:MAG: hypothetical protein IPL53_24850 [Ignavibacteria bacterium]|nr:hypothetical protein [Ignavibacteria bacterium]
MKRSEVTFRKHSERNNTFSLSRIPFFDNVRGIALHLKSFFSNTERVFANSSFTSFSFEQSRLSDETLTHNYPPISDKPAPKTVSNVSPVVSNGSSAVNNDFDVVNNDFDAVNNDFDVVNNDFDAVNNDFDAVNNDFDAVNNDFDAVNNDFDAVNNDFDVVNNDFDVVNNDFDVVNNDFEVRNREFDREKDTKGSDEFYNKLRGIKKFFKRKHSEMFSKAYRDADVYLHYSNEIIFGIENRFQAASLILLIRGNMKTIALILLVLLIRRKLNPDYPELVSRGRTFDGMIERY